MKKYLVMLMTAVMLIAGTAAIGAANAETGWTASNKDTTVTGNRIEGKANSEAEAVYSETFNLKTGVSVGFTVEDGDVSANNKNVIAFRFINNQAVGIELRGYPLFLDKNTAQKKKMRWDVVYLGPKLGHDDKTDTYSGEYYAESFYTYVPVFSKEHSLDIRQFQGSYFATVDGITFAPKNSMDGYDFTNCKLSVKMTSTETPYHIEITDIGTRTTDIMTGEWANLGAIESITRNEDGTTTFDGIDKNMMTDQNGTEIAFCRNVLANTSGYDVTKPIELQIHYDTSATPGVWWAVGFAASPFANLPTLTYKEDGSVASGLGASDIQQSSNRGIMFQTTTGLAEPSYSNVDAEKKPYADNGGGKSYSSLSMLNAIRIEVGTESTKVFWNDKVLFDAFPLKQSDFKGGKMYPYFKFMESPANKNKWNTMTIKGINVPVAEETSFKRLSSDTSDLSVKVDANNGHGSIFVADESYQKLASEFYAYDETSGTLTVKAAAFAGLAEGSHKFFVANDGGYEMLEVRIADVFEALEAAVITPGSHQMVKGSAETDLTLTVDFKNGTFKSFAGAGLTSSQYSYDKEAGTITVSKVFLNKLAIGKRTVKLTTQNEEGETIVTEFVITVTEAGGGSDKPGNPDEPNDPEQPGDTNDSGCGGSIGLAGGLGGGLMLIALAGIVFAVTNGKRTKKNSK